MKSQVVCVFVCECVCAYNQFTISPVITKTTQQQTNQLQSVLKYGNINAEGDTKGSLGFTYHSSILITRSELLRGFFFMS